MGFCSRCGRPREERTVRGRQRQVCTGCERIAYTDPKVAVGVVAARDGAVLLTQRNHQPKMGEWSFPSGFVDAGERVEDAAVREVKEETGIDVRVERLLGVFSEPVVKSHLPGADRVRELIERPLELLGFPNAGGIGRRQSQDQQDCGSADAPGPVLHVS